MCQFLLKSKFVCQPCDTSHLSDEDEILKSIISEEADKDSFTCVVIEGINAAHIPYLKTGTKEWTRQLAYVPSYVPSHMAPCH